MTVYEAYKPLRNAMRRFALVNGLLDVWGYGLHVIHGYDLPSQLAEGAPWIAGKRITDRVYPWDLDIIARELLLHADSVASLRLKRWADLDKVIGLIRRVDDAVWRQRDTPDIWHEMHRIAHRQFPWQRRNDVDNAVRYLKVFGSEVLEAVVQGALGMSVRQYLLLGSAMTGHFMHNPAILMHQDHAILGLTPAQSQAFFERLVATPDQLRVSLNQSVTYDSDWLYAWNPLEQRPLVQPDKCRPELLICPLPAYLFRRVTAGIFFDLVNAPGFNNPYGEAFEAYVGEVVARTCLPPRFSAVRDEAYLVKQQEQRGVDWLLTDDTGQLAIECKAKRLKLDAKIRSDPAALSSELDAMAKAVVQHYRNIRNAQAGKTPWKPSALPIFPLVLTLEDWFLFGPAASRLLDGHVRRRLDAAGISATVLDEMPYTIGSAKEFELLTRVMTQASIATVLKAKTSMETRTWSLEPFLLSQFPSEVARSHSPLFEREYLELVDRAAENRQASM